MTDGLSMEHADMIPGPDAVEPERDAWLARRELGFGASEIATLFVALGMRPADSLGSYAAKRGRAVKLRGFDPTPRIFLEKAGLKAPYASGPAAALGTRHEAQLFAESRMLIACDMAGDVGRALDPDTLQHQAAFPSELWPIVDRHAPRLTASPDGFVRNLLADLLVAEGKCSVTPYGGVPTRHVIQINAQIAACNATGGVLIEGEGWAAQWMQSEEGPRGAVRFYAVERNDALIAEIRHAVSVGWSRVEELREQHRRAA